MTILYTTIRRIVLTVCFYFARFLMLDKNSVSIICYHSIGEKKNAYSIPPELFKKQMKNMQQYYTFISLDQALSFSYTGKKPAVVLTVDDGYEDILEVVPFLQKRNIPLTLFVLSDIKHVNRKELDHNGKLLTKKQLIKLAKDGVTIGSHTATHADLTTLSKKQLEKEIISSKRSLEEIIGQQIAYFAYPKGLSNKGVRSVVKKAGYKAGLSVFSKVLTKSDDRYLIPRIVVRNTYTSSDFPEFISWSSLTIRNLFEKKEFIRRGGSL